MPGDGALAELLTVGIERLQTAREMEGQIIMVGEDIGNGHGQQNVGGGA